MNESSNMTFVGKGEEGVLAKKGIFQWYDDETTFENIPSKR